MCWKEHYSNKQKHSTRAFSYTIRQFLATYGGNNGIKPLAIYKSHKSTNPGNFVVNVYITYFAIVVHVLFGESNQSNATELNRSFKYEDDLLAFK